MSPNPPPPPPPPPLPILSIAERIAHTGHPGPPGSDGLAGNSLNWRIEADEEPLKVNQRIIFKIYRHVPPQMQEGPTCGMVALSMAIGNNQYDTEKLKTLAINNKWSINGEMFSCEWMARLGELAGAKCVCVQGGLINNLQRISDCLLDGGFVLVPYDKTASHDPGTYGGTKAHWALLLGLSIMKTQGQTTESEDGKHWQLTHPEGFTVSITSPDKLLFGRLEGCYPTAALYVYAIQGLSRYARRWQFRKLAESNANLTTVDPKREGSVCLPDGGISAGLRDQAVLLWN